MPFGHCAQSEQKSKAKNLFKKIALKRRLKHYFILLSTWAKRRGKQATWVGSADEQLILGQPPASPSGGEHLFLKRLWRQISKAGYWVTCAEKSVKTSSQLVADCLPIWFYFPAVIIKKLQRHRAVEMYAIFGG